MQQQKKSAVDNSSEDFAAEFANFEDPTSVEAVRRQRDREEGGNGKEGLNKRDERDNPKEGS